MTCHSGAFSRHLRMDELSMATVLANQYPSFLLQPFKNVPNRHLSIMTILEAEVNIEHLNLAG